MFGEGAGSSTWKRSDGQAATAKDTPEPAEFKSDWGDWDLKKDAGAAATKHFVEAVNDKGSEWNAAVQDTLTFVKTLPDVSDATVSPNGLNISIKYKNGTGDYVVTERMELAPEESVTIDSAPDETGVVAARCGGSTRRGGAGCRWMRRAAGQRLRGTARAGARA